MKSQLFKEYYFGLLLVLLSALLACEDKDMRGSKNNDEADLSKLRIEIEKLSGQSNCDAATQWGITAIGEKACGGPAGYIAYSKKIDVELFLKKVALYNQKQKAFNVKWQVMSDCSLPMQPDGVVCMEGKAKLIYNN